MRYSSYYGGKITNKYNSFQIFFYPKIRNYHPIHD